MKSKLKTSALFYLKKAIEYAGKYFIIVIIMNIFLGVCPGLFVWALGNTVESIIDYIKGYAGIVNIVFYSAVFCGIMLLKTAVSNINSNYIVKTKNRCSYRLIRDIISKLRKIKYRYWEDTEVYDLILRITEEPEDTFYVFVINYIDIFRLVLNYVSLIYWLFSINKLLFFSALIVIWPLILVGKRCGEDRYRIRKETMAEKRRAEYLSELLSCKNAVAERNIFDYSKMLSMRYKDSYYSYKRQEFSVLFKNMIHSETIGIITNSVLIILVLILIKSIGEGIVGIGILAGVLSQVIEFSGNMRWGIVQNFKVWTEGRCYYADYKRIMSLEEYQGGNKAVDSEINKIELKGLSFGYTTERVINNIDFSFEKGKTYVIVGENGSGKTTLVKLLSGLYDSYEGELLVNDVEMREIDGEYIKNNISVLHQDFCIYPISIKENCLMGSSVSYDEELYEKMGLSVVADNLPLGKDTIIKKIDSESVELSGGENQKIAILRCLSKKAGIVILDEPTSSIDPVLESDIYDIFDQVGENTIKIIISHRLGIASIADTIVLMDNGRIVCSGSHDELYNKSLLYKNMYDKQKEWYV